MQERGVLRAGKGRPIRNEKIFNRQREGREADNDEDQTLQKLLGEPRVLVGIFLLRAK